MPRYFFSLTNGTRICDPEGEECPTLDAAKELARQTAKELSRNKRPAQLVKLDVCVLDETGTELFRAPLIE